MRRRARIVGAGLILLSTAHASADEAARRDARQHLQQGEQFYEEEAFEAARAEFTRAYELSKSYRVLYNLALVTSQLNDFVGAYRDYERYLHEGGDEIAPSRREEVVLAMAKLRSRVALVEVVTAPEGADLTIDDRPADPNALMVNPGEHKIGASAPRHRPAYAYVSLTAGESRRVALQLQEDTPRTVVVPAPPPRSTLSVAWAYWIPSFVLAAGTATTGVLALRAQDDLEKIRRAPAAADDPDALDRQGSRTKTLAAAADVLGAASILAIGAGVYFTIRAVRAERAPQTRVGFGLGALSIMGGF